MCNGLAKVMTTTFYIIQVFYIYRKCIAHNYSKIGMLSSKYLLVYLFSFSLYTAIPMYVCAILSKLCTLAACTMVNNFTRIVKDSVPN